MPVKLIIADLDGTLLGTDHQTISERTISALKRASEHGITIAIGSGRTYSVLKNVLRQTDSIDYVMMSNGAAILNNRTKEQTRIGEIPYEQWLPLYHLLKKYGAVFEVYQEGQSYIERETKQHFLNEAIPQAFLEEMTECMVEVETLPGALKGKALEKIDVIQTPDEQIEELARILQSREELIVTSSIPGNMEINLRGADKGAGTRELCRMLGIRTEQVMAFGDADNDLEMMKTAGHSYAMGNASEEIKRTARYLTTSNAEDGVALAIERMLERDFL